MDHNPIAMCSCWAAALFTFIKMQLPINMTLRWPGSKDFFVILLQIASHQGPYVWLDKISEHCTNVKLCYLCSLVLWPQWKHRLSSFANHSTTERPRADAPAGTAACTLQDSHSSTCPRKARSTSGQQGGKSEGWEKTLFNNSGRLHPGYLRMDLAVKEWCQKTAPGQGVHFLAHRSPAAAAILCAFHVRKEKFLGVLFQHISRTN